MTERPESAETEARPGLRVADFELVEPLGEGGFATVWLARHHLWPERTAAAKLLRDPEQIQHLRDEGRCLAALDHPNVARAIGIDLDHDPPYLLVEYVPGRTLRAVLDEESPLPPSRVVSVFAQIVDALAASHAAGVVHGDLKPENILVAPGGDDDAADDVVKVTDFGLGTMRARQASLQVSRDLATEVRSLVGTIPYMAPEQQGGGPADTRTDVFTLGVLLFELATGRRPQPGDDLETAELPQALREAFGRCYTRPERRFADAVALRAAVSSGGGGLAARAVGRGVATGAEACIVSPDAIETAVAAEAGVPIDELRTGSKPKSPKTRAARSLAILLIHHHARLAPLAIADRYGCSAQDVREILDETVGDQDEELLLGAVERLAPLPVDAGKRLRNTEATVSGLATFSGVLGVGGIGSAIAAGALATSGNAVGATILGVIGAVGFAFSFPVKAHAETALHGLERWLEQALPDATRRERLERLALRYDMPRLRAEAERRLLAESESPTYEPVAESESVPVADPVAEPESVPVAVPVAVPESAAEPESALEREREPEPSRPRRRPIDERPTRAGPSAAAEPRRLIEEA